MNCYYSNLIEGHDTHPIDIELALKGDYSRDASKRDLQLEAKAHIAVQQWIDTGASASNCPKTCCGSKISRPRTGSKLFPASAAAHHRLTWLHPFLDGNGRVARLVSHATLLDVLDTGAVWSIARGLARNVSDYKAHFAACDLPRRNNLDGRGTLSGGSLAAFTKFFLNVCLDQVAFMEGLMQPAQLRSRILSWADEETRLSKLPPKANNILEALLYRGELPRGDTAAIVGTGERQARRVVSAPADLGAITSGSTRAPLRLAFPAALASRWMPGLFPDKVA